MRQVFLHLCALDPPSKLWKVPGGRKCPAAMLIAASQNRHGRCQINAPGVNLGPTQLPFGGAGPQKCFKLKQCQKFSVFLIGFVTHQF